MNAITYNKLFDDIIEGEINTAPYDNPEYINYVKLNKSRSKRWDKRGDLTEELKKVVGNIQEEQTWIMISEPWCGDAAHSAPMIQKISAINDKITLEIQLRDSNSEIEKYLTNGGKAVPKLIVRDKAGKDIFTWGPRPKGAQELVLAQKNREDLTTVEKYTNILQWYIKDDGISIQEEIVKSIKKAV